MKWSAKGRAGLWVWAEVGESAIYALLFGHDEDVCGSSRLWQCEAQAIVSNRTMILSINSSS